MQKVVAREGEPLNVLLIVTDSTRRDFVSIYGEDKLAHTPNLDALGKQGLVFDRAVPEAMPTVAVRRALLTGTRSFPFRDSHVARNCRSSPAGARSPPTSASSPSSSTTPESRPPTSPTTRSWWARASSAFARRSIT